MQHIETQFVSQEREQDVQRQVHGRGHSSNNDTATWGTSEKTVSICQRTKSKC